MSEKLLIADHGLFVSFAEALQRQGAEVVYSPISSEGFPSYNTRDVGKDLPGITHAPDRFDFIRKVVDKSPSDWTLVYPDVHDGPEQEFLRSKGYRVWGSGDGGDLELYRYFGKRIMEAVDLPVQPYRIIVGIDALRNFLKAHDGKLFHIKVSFIRGLTETFHAERFWESDLVLDELAHRLGAKKNEQEFIVEDDVPTEIEVGADTICVDGQYLELCLNGVERKDAAYGFIMQRTKELPEELRTTLEALIPVFKRYGYRNTFSTETRVHKDGTPYTIDFTCRHASPAGECIQEAFSNLPDIIRNGAEGKLIKPDATHAFGVQAMMYSDKADDEWQGVSFPEELRPWVKLYFHRRRGGHDWTMPQPNNKMCECGSVVALADSPEEAEKLCRKRAEQVKGDKLHFKIDEIEGVFSEFDEMKKHGMDLTPATA